MECEPCSKEWVRGRAKETEEGKGFAKKRFERIDDLMVAGGTAMPQRDGHVGDGDTQSGGKDEAVDARGTLSDRRNSDSHPIADAGEGERADSTLDLLTSSALRPKFAKDKRLVNGREDIKLNDGG